MDFAKQQNCLNRKIASALISVAPGDSLRTGLSRFVFLPLIVGVNADGGGVPRRVGGGITFRGKSLSSKEKGLVRLHLAAINGNSRKL